jgi:hypothetical protein
MAEAAYSKNLLASRFASASVVSGPSSVACQKLLRKNAAALNLADQLNHMVYNGSE